MVFCIASENMSASARSPKPHYGPFRDKDQGRDLSGTVQGAGGICGLLSATHHTSPATQYFFTYDANGNVSDLIATNGEIAGHYEYGPYGNVFSSTGSESTNNVFRFSTKYWDDEVGLGYWGYRYYHPDEGRWLGRDPIGGNEYLVRTDKLIELLNLYSLVFNDPENEIDLIGLMGSGPIPSPSPMDYGQADLENMLLSICSTIPRKLKETILEPQCCAPESCREQAKKYAAALAIRVKSTYDKNSANHSGVVIGGWKGNFRRTYGHDRWIMGPFDATKGKIDIDGRNCQEWSARSTDAWIDAIKPYFMNHRGCLRLLLIKKELAESDAAWAGGGWYWGSKPSSFEHHWAVMVPPYYEGEAKTAVLGMGIEIDPWPSGGKAMLGLPLHADPVDVNWAYGFPWP